MDNAFHLIDGAGISKYPENAITAIENAAKNQDFAETEYFRFQWYKNGNLHIKFKRMDLVNKINQIAGDRLLGKE